MKIIMMLDSSFVHYGWENPFRYTEIFYYYRIQETVVSPTGGDDTLAIQKTIDELPEPELVKIGIERKWRFPWHPPVRLIKINARKCLRFAAGNFNIGQTLKVPSNTEIDGGGMSTMLIGPHPIIEIKPGIKNVFVHDCHFMTPNKQRSKGECLKR